MAHSILSNTVIATTGRLLNATLGLVAISLLTRSLGDANFGSYSLIFSYGALVQLVADFGLYLTLTREISQHPAEEQHVVSHVLMLRSLLLVVAFAAGLVAAQWIPNLAPFKVALLLAAGGLMCQSLSQIFMGIYQKYGVVWRVIVGDLVGRVVQITGLWWLSQGHPTLSAAVGVFALSSLVSFLLHQAFLPIARPRPHAINWATWKQLLKISWPLGLMLILNGIYFRIDMVILSLFRPAAEVGHYALAYRVIESGLFFPAMFGGLLLPRLSAAIYRRERQLLQQLLAEGLHVLAFVAAFIVIMLAVLPDSLVVFLSNSAFSPAAPLLRILSSALAIMFFGNLFGFSLVALDKRRQLLWLYTGLVPFNCLINLWLIPQYGATAAAWTTVATEAISASVAAVLVWRSIRYHLSPFLLLRIVLAAGATVGLVKLLPTQLHVLIQVGVAACFYLGLSVLLRTVRREHVGLLLRSTSSVTEL